MPQEPKKQDGSVLHRIERYKAPTCVDAGYGGKETYDHRLAGRAPVPPTRVDTLVCDMWLVMTKELGLTGLKPESVTWDQVSEVLRHYLQNPWVKLPGYRPWTHWNFIRQLNNRDHEPLGREVAEYIKTVGVRDVVDDPEEMLKDAYFHVFRLGLVRCHSIDEFLKSLTGYDMPGPVVSKGLFNEWRRLKLEVDVLSQARNVDRRDDDALGGLIGEVALRRARRYARRGWFHWSKTDPQAGDLSAIKFTILFTLPPAEVVKVVADWEDRGLDKEAAELVRDAFEKHGDAFGRLYNEWLARKHGRNP